MDEIRETYMGRSAIKKLQVYLAIMSIMVVLIIGSTIFAGWITGEANKKALDTETSYDEAIAIWDRLDEITSPIYAIMGLLSWIVFGMIFALTGIIFSINRFKIKDNR